MPGRRLALLFVLMGILLFFFSLWAIYSLRKDRYVGMIISDEGITDLSTGYRIGTVLWNDVTKIKVMDDLENLNYKYVVLVVKNPNQYIARTHSNKKTIFNAEATSIWLSYMFFDTGIGLFF